MNKKLEFNIELDENFHIIIEDDIESIPEPLPEESYIIEFQDIDNSINNKKEETKDNLKEEKSQMNLNMSINSDIYKEGDLISILHNNISQIINHQEIIDKIDESIDNEIYNQLNIDNSDLIERYKNSKKNT
jgi:hypothetical protein